MAADGGRQSRFDPQTLSLAIANTRQSVIKHGLTEADRIAVGRISPLRDQGGYAVAMNYGESSL
jgi:oligosaccharide translocation protein RFT1